MADNPKFTLADLRGLRAAGQKLAMLTCYDFSTARLMQRAGVRALLVGDSAANVILGHPNTLPISLQFMIDITAAVRRGAPDCLLVADMPFGSYQASAGSGFRNVTRMVQLSGCDCVKIEAGASQARLVSRLADAGVAVMAHLGLRPQQIGLLGRYQARGRTAEEARWIVDLARRMEKACASAILLEAVPPPVSAAVVEAVSIPVIGCGAGPACDGHVFVTHDGIGLSDRKPKFAPKLGDVATPMINCFSEFVRMVESGKYPAPENCYEMPEAEKEAFRKRPPL
ncbi:MAG: 3-methyl-2-oxobutanoate hydroxymethyltransferase [Tepidisphaeraceae bacterium]|jgi:3-methyl-2-oxobutanoate hydroxymethyltransferase